MKFFLLATFLFVAFQAANASNPYRLYLLLQVKTPIAGSADFGRGNNRYVFYYFPVVPKYEIPKAAVFCRMEDKLTRVTGVWIKVGVK